MSTTTLTARPAIGAELTAATAAGATMVEQAEAFSAEFAEGALEHDRSASFAVEHLDRLCANGFLASPIPVELGGAGVDSVHDVLVAMSRLARGDAATSIGVNMHFAVLLNIVRRWQVASARGETEVAESLAGSLQLIAAADVVFATAISEPSPQDLTRPSTRAVRVDEGWRIDGHKVFATMAPAATMINVGVMYQDDNGDDRYGFGLVPASAPGVFIPMTGMHSACGPLSRARCRSTMSASEPTRSGTAFRQGAIRPPCSTASSRRAPSTPRRHSASPSRHTNASSTRSAGGVRQRSTTRTP